jgi:hypothetical protein
LLAPLMLLLLVLVAWHELGRRKAWAVAGAITLAALVAPTAWFVTHQSDEALGRFRRISIAQPDRQPAEVVGLFVLNYARHFDPIYLAVRGDRTLRHSPTGIGQIYPIEFLFLLAGIYFLARRRNAATAVVLGWLAIAPVAASLTEEGIPHALRSLAGVPAFALAIALGMVETIRRIHATATRNAVIAGIMLIEIASVGWFVYDYRLCYPAESAQAWQAGFAEALDYCQANAQPGDRIWVSGSVGMRSRTFAFVSPGEAIVAFKGRIEPAEFQRTRLEGSRWRVLGWEFGINPLLTARLREPTFLIAFVGEMGERKPLAVFAGQPQPELAVGVYRF